MNLAEHLQNQEQYATHVLVGHGSAYPVEEYHPIARDCLAILRRVWTSDYYTYQANLAHRGKCEAIVKTTRAIRRKALRGLITVPQLDDLP